MPRGRACAPCRPRRTYGMPFALANTKSDAFESRPHRNIDVKTGLIKNRDGVCLDGSERNGGAVRMWACDRTLHHLPSPSTAFLRLPSPPSPTSHRLPSPFRQVLMWACDPTDHNQQWHFDPATGQIRRSRRSLLAQHASACSACLCLLSMPQLAAPHPCLRPLRACSLQLAPRPDAPSLLAPLPASLPSRPSSAS